MAWSLLLVRVLAGVVVVTALGGATCTPRVETARPGIDHARECVAGIERREYDHAALQCKLCLEYNERDPECLNAMGLVYYARGHDDDARSFWNHAIRENNDFAQPRSNIGVLEFENANYQGAVPFFESAIEIDPHFLPARYNLALAWLRTGQKRAIDGDDATDAYAHAKEQYELLIEIEPKHARAWGDMGVIASWRAQYTAKTGNEERALTDEAERDFVQCLALAPGDPDCTGNLEHLRQAGAGGVGSAARVP